MCYNRIIFGEDSLIFGELLFLAELWKLIVILPSLSVTLWFYHYFFLKMKLSFVSTDGIRTEPVPCSTAEGLGATDLRAPWCRGPQVSGTHPSRTSHDPLTTLLLSPISFYSPDSTAADGSRQRQRRRQARAGSSAAPRRWRAARLGARPRPHESWAPRPRGLGQERGARA